MPQIADISKIAGKFSRVTPGRSAEYTEGVASSQKDWAGNTAAAEANYNTGVQNAIAKKLFGAGVRKAGSEKWRKNTVEKGGARWAPGVAAAGDAYAQGFAPYAQTIASTTLPPRYPRGDARNMARVSVMAEALRKKKVGA